jgi:hypothetical protein
MHDISFDPGSKCLLIHVAGFWQPEQLPAFAAALEAAVLKARSFAPDFCAVIESFDFPVQANDVADMLGELCARCMAMTTGQVAVVVGSHLNKLQVERTLIHERLRPFRTMEEARDWLGLPDPGD